MAIKVKETKVLLLMLLYKLIIEFFRRREQCDQIGRFISQIFGYFWSYFKASLFEKKMVWLLFCQLFENLGYFFILRMWLHLAPALLLILSPACLAGNHYWWMNNPSVFSSGNQGGSSQGGDSGSYGAPSQNLQVDSQGKSHFLFIGIWTCNLSEVRHYLDHCTTNSKVLQSESTSFVLFCAGWLRPLHSP